MADVKLKSLKFPGLPNRYVIPTDAEDFTFENENLADVLQKKANIDGYYDELTAGSAEQLISSQFVEDSEPYKFRTTGGSADVGSREQVDAIVGGSIAWNQLISNPLFENNQITGWDTNGTATASSGVCTFNAGARNVVLRNTGLKSAKGALTNHHLLQVADMRCSQNYAIQLIFGDNTNFTDVKLVNLTSEWKSYGYIYPKHTVQKDLSFIGLRDSNTQNFQDVQIRNMCVFDLTQIFGEEIADYIYGIETSNTGAGVALFKKLFPKYYYEYDTGTLKSVEGLSSHNTIGFNQWDEEWELGGLSISGNLIAYTDRIRSKNPIRVLPSTTYCIRCGTANAIMAHAYDANLKFIENVVGTTVGENGVTFTTPYNAEYLRFATGTEYGVTYKNDICINLSWSGWRNGEYEAYQKHSYPLDSSLTLRGIPKLSADNKMYYDGDEYAPDGTVTRKYGIRAYQSGDESLADAITDGTNTVYKLSTPTTETAEPFTRIQNCDDFGTEEYVSTSIVPVGHDTKYPANLRDKLQHLPDLADNDGYYMIKQASKQMSLEPFRIPKAPSENGTYVLKATVSGGTPTYTWVEEN